MASNSFHDIVKGFRRLGNFPAFDDEIFTTYDAASAYASAGPYGGSAYIGQLIRVIPTEENSDPKIYIVNNEYKLVSTEDAISVNDNLSINFNFKSQSGSSAISLILPQGFLLNTITVRFIEGFKNDDALRVALCPYNNTSQVEYLIASGSGEHLNDVIDFYDPKFTLITDEDDSEFVFKFTEILQTRTLLVIYLDRTIDPDELGSGILKIN